MPEQTGVEAIRSFIAAVGTIVCAIIRRAKDGVGADDVIALVADQNFRDAVQILIAKGKELPAEAKDLSLAEGLELAPDVARLIVAIIQAVKA
jgi:hypothetical protein